MSFKYLRPEDVRSLASFEYAPKAVVEGFLAGRHRSRAVGPSTEFRDYRPYVPGDDLRQIDWKVYALDMDRDVIRKRVRSRLENRFGNGMVDEVRGLMAAGLSLERLEHLGLEYREIAAYLPGRKDRRQMVDDLAIAIGRFAKRQGTWFRGMERRGVPVTWIAPENAARILEDVAEWIGDE